MRFVGLEITRLKDPKTLEPFSPHEPWTQTHLVPSSRTSSDLRPIHTAVCALLHSSHTPSRINTKDFIQRRVANRSVYICSRRTPMGNMRIIHTSAVYRFAGLMLLAESVRHVEGQASKYIAYTDLECSEMYGGTSWTFGMMSIVDNTLGDPAARISKALKRGTLHS